LVRTEGSAGRTDPAGTAEPITGGSEPPARRITREIYCRVERNLERGIHLEAREAARLLNRCSCAIAFMGAGISTESGIPDFRGSQGL